MNLKRLMPVVLSYCLHAASSLAVPQSPLAGVDARTLQLPSGPGSLRGLAAEADVDAFSAQLVYQVPIEVPKGRAGVQPALALTYDGSLGNGLLGLGFSLGIPRIERSTRLGVPSYGSTDEIELSGLGGGGRLVADGVGGWRVEGRGNALRVLQPAQGQGFEVTDANGTVFIFGDTSASRIEDGLRVSSWHLARIRYRSQDTIDYSYTKDEANLYPDRIVYGQGGALSVRFVYELRALDPSASYRTGFRVGLRRRLTALETRVAATLVRTYQLAYDPTSTLSRLASVRGVAASGEQLPATSFLYGSRSAPGVTAMANVGGWVLYTNDVLPLDVDGDGLADLARFSLGGYSYRRNLGDRFASPAPISGTLTGLPPSTQIRLMSMSGRSLPELVYAQGQSWQLLRLEAGRWVAAGTWSSAGPLPALTSTSVEFTDLNGDGRTDAIEDRGGALSVRFAGRNGFGAVVARPAPGAGVVRPGVPGVRFQDMTGDGLADAVQLGTSRVTIWPGLGDGTFGTSYAFTGFTAASIDDLWLADLNRDGLTDLVLIQGTSVTPLFASPSGALRRGVVVTAPTSQTPDLRVAIGDLNGNGSEDLIWSNAQGTWAVDLAGPTSAGMLTQISNGIGGETVVVYSPSSVLALAAEVATPSRPWIEKLAVSIPVPTSTQTFLSSGGVRTVNLSVRDAFWDHEEQRFGGFLGSTRTLVGDGAADTLVETTQFEAGRGAERVLRGRARSVERRDGSGRLLDRENTSWQARHLVTLPGADPRLAVPVALSISQERFEGTNTPVASSTTFVFGDDGDVIEEHFSGRADRFGDERHVFRTFARNDVTWVRNRLVTERIEGAGGTVLADRRLRYDGATAAPLALGLVTDGRPRLTERRQVETGRWLTEEAHDYDLVGNVVAITEQGVRRELEYDSTGRFAVAETVRPSANDSLTWRATWSAELGVISSLTDPNGVVVTVGSDGLGRTTTLARNGAPPHVSYAYAWSAPRPRTTTTLVDGPVTRITHEVLDSRGDPLYSVRQLASGVLLVESHVARSARGEKTRVFEPYVLGSFPTSAPASVASTRFSFDALGRELSRLAPDGVSRSHAYGPLTVTETTTGLAPVTRELSANGKVIATTRTIAGVNEFSESTYDAEDRLTSVSLQGGSAVHSYRYDSLGRLTEVNDTDSGSLTLRYDDRGFLLERRNSAGQAITYMHDNLGRVVKKVVDDGGRFEFQYDRPATGSSGTNTRGRLAAVIEPTGRVDLSYDLGGALATWSRSIDGRTMRLTRVHGANGLLLSESSDVVHLDFHYDGAGRLIRAGDVWEATALDESGRIIDERFSNGVTGHYTYGSAGRLDAVVVRDASSNRTRLLDVQVAQRSPFGAPLALRDFDSRGLDHTASYGFDSASRLTSATMAGRTFSYAYDALGNLTSRQVVGAAVPAALGQYRYEGVGPRQLTSAGTLKLEYDAAGRANRVGGALLAHDADDRLTSYADGTGQVSYSYGFDGERVLSTGGAIEERVFTRDVLDRGSTREHLVFVGSRLVARLAAQPASLSNPRPPPVVTSVHSGLDGAPAILTDGSGRVIEERRFEPFGAVVEGDLALEPYSASNKPADSTTGLVDHGARWLAPVVGRWLTPDPLIREGGDALAAQPWKLSLYAYADNDPVTNWDPDGRDPKPKGRLNRTGTSAHQPPAMLREPLETPKFEFRGKNDFTIELDPLTWTRTPGSDSLSIEKGPAVVTVTDGTEPDGSKSVTLTVEVEGSLGPASVGGEAGVKGVSHGVKSYSDGAEVGLDWFARVWAKFRGQTVVEHRTERTQTVTTRDLGEALLGDTPARGILDPRGSARAPIPGE